jgi:hypothetical protein
MTRTKKQSTEAAVREIRRKTLTSNFEKAYTIERRFGIEVASVWRRL